MISHSRLISHTLGLLPLALSLALFQITGYEVDISHHIHFLLPTLFVKVFEARETIA